MVNIKKYMLNSVKEKLKELHGKMQADNKCSRLHLKRIRIIECMVQNIIDEDLESFKKNKWYEFNKTC